MLFKSDTMNALVACDLLDEGYSIDESLEALDSFSFLLEEGRSGELYSLVLTEGSRLDEGKKSRQTLRDKSNRAMRRAREAQAGEREAKAGQAEAEASRSRVEGEAMKQTQKAKEAGPKGFAAGKEKGAEEATAAAKAKMKAGGGKAAKVIAKTRAERDKAKGEAEKAKGEAEGLKLTARGSDARKKTADRLRKLRGTVADLKSKQGKGEDGKGQDGPSQEGGKDDRTLRDKIYDTGDHLERENLRHTQPRRPGRTGPDGPAPSPRGGGRRGPDTGSADATDQERPPRGSGESKEDAEHRRGEEKAEGAHRREMEKTEHERKQAGRAKWGDTIRKGVEGAGSLVKKGAEGLGKGLAGAAKLAGDAARGLGRGIERMDKARTSRYQAQTKDRTAEGEHKRGMERDAQSQKHERGMKTAREGETSAERMAARAETGKERRAETSRAKAETPDQIRSRAAARMVDKGRGSGGSEGGDAAAKFRADREKAKKVSRNVRMSQRRIGRKATAGVRSHYSPQENNPELGIMSEHLKVDQSGSQDHWQNLMEDVIANKRGSLLNEAKKKRRRKEN